ncbi:hypothetical protein KY290_021911 [Solanum tuberosum]|uniref:Uncharacterized protein n=1 Tax=Solanum tuberosum TaxID=4113 RepID=A0ABQ7V2W2_SOLTU|nr:hypothetical protein KY290_021911 [Solanum tuberosum]
MQMWLQKWTPDFKPGVAKEKEAKKNKEAMEEAVNLQEQNNTELSNDEIYRMAMIPTTKANKS